MDQTLRETIDALNAAARGMHEQATGHHAVADGLRRLEERVKELGPVLSEKVHAEIASLREDIGRLAERSTAAEAAIEAQSKAIGALAKDLEIANEVDEKTDAFRREVIEGTGKVLQSRPAMMVYAVLGFFFLQTLGVQVSPGLREWVGRAILGLPSQPSESPDAP